MTTEAYWIEAPSVDWTLIDVQCQARQLLEQVVE